MDSAVRVNPLFSRLAPRWNDTLIFMKKVLVTGAAGFIGFHLCKHLKERGDFVVGLDNFNDYYDPSLKRARAQHLEGVEVVEGDIVDINCLERLVDKYSITHIVNLAAQAGVRYSLEKPQAYVDSNITGFLNVLEVCRKHPKIKLVYASSSSVYGLNEKIPFSEEDRTDTQASLYGVTKKSNELMAHAYHHLFGISVIGLRYFTVYGPWGRPDMAYYLFAEAIVQEKPIKIFNNGNLMRDFTYIDDIIKGTVAAIDHDNGCAVYNLGNHRPVKLMHFIAILEEALGKKAVKEMLPMQPGDVYQTYADITESKKDLGFSPTTPLEEGIPLFTNWFANNDKSR